MQKTVVIDLEHGLEARPIALVVQIASQFESNIYVELEGKKVNAKSIMGMMSLSLQRGEEVVVTAEGSDEEKAIIEIEKFLSGSEE